MKKKNKKYDANLSIIIDEEIKYNSLRQGFPKSLSTYLKKIEGKKISNHKDLTNIPFVTIDGEDSKDFDDAVWSRHENNETTIMVASAPVGLMALIFSTQYGVNPNAITRALMVTTLLSIITIPLVSKLA